MGDRRDLEEAVEARWFAVGTTRDSLFLPSFAALLAASPPPPGDDGGGGPPPRVDGNGVLFERVGGGGEGAEEVDGIGRGKGELVCRGESEKVVEVGEIEKVAGGGGGEV